MRYSKHKRNGLVSWDRHFYSQSKERQEIINLLLEEGTALKDKEIAEILGKSYDTIRKTTYRMYKDGLLVNVSRGKYFLSSSLQFNFNSSSPTVDSSPSSPSSLNDVISSLNGLNWDSDICNGTEVDNTCSSVKVNNYSGFNVNGTNGTGGGHFIRGLNPVRDEIIDNYVMKFDDYNGPEDIFSGNSDFNSLIFNSIAKFATTEEKIQRLENRKKELEDDIKHILATQTNVDNMETLMAEHSIVCNTLEKIDGIFNMMGALLRG